MAKAPDFQQSISPSNFKAYVQQGVVDKSKGMQAAAEGEFISSLASTGIEAYKAYDKQSTLADVTEQLKQLEEERSSRSLEGIQNLQQGIASSEGQLQMIKQSAGYDESYPMMLNTELDQQTRGITGALEEQTSKLMRAKEQGIMKEFELGERLAKITREAVSRNPAYAGEIMGQVSKVADMLNITARVKQDVKTVKDQQDAVEADLKKLVDTGVALGVFPWQPKYQTPQGTDYQSYMMDVNRMGALKENKTRLDFIKESRVTLNALNAEEYSASGQFSIDQETIINSFSDDALEIINSDAPNKELLLNNLEKDLNIYVNKLMVNSGLSYNDPSIKDGVSYVKDQIKTLKEGFIGTANGTYDRTKLDNDISVNKNIAIKRLAKDFEAEGKDLYKFNYLMDMAKDFPELLRSDFINQSWKDIQKSTYTIGTPDDDGYSIRAIKPRKELNNKSSLQDYTERTLRQAKANETDIPKFDEALEKHIRVIGNDELTQQQGVLATRNLINSLQDPSIKDLYGKLDPTTIMNANQNVLNFSTVLENTTREFKNANPDLKLETVRRDDGTIAIKGLPVGSTFSRAVKEINASFRAFYHTSGMSLEQAANEFYATIPSLGLTGVPPSQKQ